MSATPAATPAKKKVLIVCTANSCRSQMAEALWRREAGDRWEVASAGTQPAGVNPLALQVIGELGIDTSGQYSKSVYELNPRDFDLVITVCDSASQACPQFGSHPNHRHWPFPDPVGATGNPEQRVAEFRRVRDLIHRRIRSFLRAGDDSDSDRER